MYMYLKSAGKSLKVLELYIALPLWPMFCYVKRRLKIDKIKL